MEIRKMTSITLVADEIEGAVCRYIISSCIAVNRIGCLVFISGWMHRYLWRN